MTKRKLNTYVLTYPIGREIKQIQAEEVSMLDALTYFKYKLGIRLFKAVRSLDCSIKRI